MITLSCKLTFERKEDEKAVSSLTRKFSSSMRYAYRRLLEGWERKELKRHLQDAFGINSRYADDAILRAQMLLKSCAERGQNPKKVVFGGRKLFERLTKASLSSEQKKSLKRSWRERRTGFLYARGDKSKKGNLNARVLLDQGPMRLRINVGQRSYILANIQRKVTRKNDKWTAFTARLVQAEQMGEYFPYSVAIRRIKGKFYAFISYEEVLPPTTLTTKNGVLGLDVNAKPFHIAVAFVSADGNFEGQTKITLHPLLYKTRNQREYLSWQVAGKIVEIARVQQKAIVMENLRHIPKGRRGDGMARLRKAKQQWIYKGLLEKIEALAKRQGIEVRKVNPAFTSIIGMLKYAPQYRLDKDVAAAFVVGRRGMGFGEALPKHYQRLLADKNFMEQAQKRLEEERARTKGRLKGEENPYKQKPLRRKLGRLNKGIRFLREQQSPDGEPQTQQPGHRGKERVRGRGYPGNKLWRVAWVASTFLLLGRELPRDLSPLKPVLVSGAWERMAARLGPPPGGGPACSNVRFG